MASAQEITLDTNFDPSRLQVIATRPKKTVEIVEYDEEWPARFNIIYKMISKALGDRALSIRHVGSTSVPGLPAKAVIDVDVVVLDPRAEENYVPYLEAAGFQFLHREPAWHEHRFFGLKEPYANIHVFGQDSVEVVRHQIFREWLLNNAEDRDEYARIKRQAAQETREAGEGVMEYNERKQEEIRRILHRAFRANGLE
ncbi:grpb/dephospho-CoA kinase [Talaromyces proteolyticus]|uniref:Grpb/dephospho-CoA kinase n=1 Tax=Talaromyces proteolyticus TaxID=1131652 RepID=A0AAD4KD99_9EURO|nr:grpb/dephospho-CoA kinase [Talaromyces proteolyticus]KAH8689391.1 grpb/dephospho-CoA kinase [Talaromyces proteolyticus]